MPVLGYLRGEYFATPRNPLEKAPTEADLAEPLGLERLRDMIDSRQEGTVEVRCPTGYGALIEYIPEP